MFEWNSSARPLFEQTYGLFKISRGVMGICLELRRYLKQGESYISFDSACVTMIYLNLSPWCYRFRYLQVYLEYQLSHRHQMQVMQSLQCKKIRNIRETNVQKALFCKHKVLNNSYSTVEVPKISPMSLV